MHKAMSAIGFMLGISLLFILSLGGIQTPPTKTVAKVKMKQVIQVTKGYQAESRIMGHLQNVMLKTETLKDYEVSDHLQK